MSEDIKHNNENYLNHCKWCGSPIHTPFRTCQEVYGEPCLFQKTEISRILHEYEMMSQQDEEQPE